MTTRTMLAERSALPVRIYRTRARVSGAGEAPVVVSHRYSINWLHFNVVTLARTDRHGLFIERAGDQIRL